jgi:hypothetical protein
MNLIGQGIIEAYFPQRLFYYKAFQAVSQPDPATSTQWNQTLCDRMGQSVGCGSVSLGMSVNWNPR